MRSPSGARSTWRFSTSRSSSGTASIAWRSSVAIWSNLWSSAVCADAPSSGASSTRRRSGSIISISCSITASRALSSSMSSASSGIGPIRSLSASGTSSRAYSKRGLPSISTIPVTTTSRWKPKASRIDPATILSFFVSGTEKEMIRTKKQTSSDIRSAKVTIHRGAPSGAAFLAMAQHPRPPRAWPATGRHAVASRCPSGR